MRISIGLLVLLLAYGPAPFKNHNLVKQNDLNAQQKLELNTTIIKSEYCYSPTNLVMTLHMVFTNVGRETILLQKKSSVISKYLIADSLRHATNKQYLKDITLTLDMRGAGYTPDSRPELSLFAKLNPGESYSTEHDVVLPVLERNHIQPGNYFMQVKVITWYYPYEWSEEYRERWRQEGFLWTRIVTSNPMQFEVKRGEPAGSCERDNQQL